MTASDSSGSLPKPKKRKGGWTITGRIVPPGTLAPNPYHPLANLTTEERQKLFLQAIGDLVLTYGPRTGTIRVRSEPEGCSEGAA